MTYVRVSGFKIFKDRHGKQRCYHRKTGIKIDLERAPIGSAAFLAECDKINALLVAVPGQGPKPGTLGGPISTYFGLDHCADLSAATRRDYRQCSNFLEPIFDTPVVKIDTPLLSRIHDRASEKIGWRRANMMKTFLSEVFRHCIPRGLIDKNYVTAVIPKARPKGLARANRPWTSEECTVVMKLAPLHIKGAIAMMMYMGIDPSDALSIKKSDVADGIIWGARGKTQTDLAVPASDKLRAGLDQLPPHNAETVLANTRGQTWTYNGFSTVWDRFKKPLQEEGLIGPGLTLKGLRHRIATELRENGVSTRDIADILGQKTESMPLWYSRDAVLAGKNVKTFTYLEGPEAKAVRASKVVKPAGKSVKPDPESR